MQLNRKTVIVASIGLLAAGTQVKAQTFGYSAGDVLLNFRDTATVPGGNDLEINAGTVSALTGASGTQELVTPGTVATDLGVSTISSVGFSAAAADATGTDGLIYLTRDSNGSLPGTTPSNPFTQQTYSTQNKVNGLIANIGTGANNGNVLAQGVSLVAAGTSGNNYQAQGEQSTSVTGQGVINFQGNVNVNNGTIEDIGASYLALWEVPATTTKTGGTISPKPAEDYLGYFTFQADGEVDFTSAVATSPVPEPATYAMFGGIGLAALAMRRQLRSFIA